MDRQVLSLTWKDFIAPEFHWTNDDYGNITALFSLIYAIGMLFAGRLVDWLDTKKVHVFMLFVELQLLVLLPETGLSALKGPKKLLPKWMMLQ